MKEHNKSHLMTVVTQYHALAITFNFLWLSG